MEKSLLNSKIDSLIDEINNDLRVKRFHELSDLTYKQQLERKSLNLALSKNIDYEFDELLKEINNLIAIMSDIFSKEL